MAIALLGKCVALLALIVLLYATCYGFRVRDIVSQTHHPTVCVSTHGRVCPMDRTVTTGGPISIRKWHEGMVPRTIAGDRKPPAESMSDAGMGRIRIEKITEHPRDKGATRVPRSSRIESDEIDDDEEEEEVVVEVESVEEDEESVGDSERDQADEKTDDEEEEEASETELSDQDAEDKEKKVKKKFSIDDDDDKSEDNDDEDEEDDDEDEDEDDNEDEDEDKNDDKKSFKKDSKKQMKKIKTTKIVKSIKYGKSRADDDDDKEEEDDKEEKKAAKIDQRKVTESLKNKFSAPHKKENEDDDEDEDEDEDEESDVKETTPAPRKLEKVRLADKDKTRTTILQSKRDVEKPKQDDKKPADVAKSAMKAESVKKTIESTKRIESVESTKESIESSTKKSVESAKKLTEGTKKVESVKGTSKPKAEVPEIATKVDEKSKTRVKPETSTPAPKIKEQAKQPEKADVKKVTAKPTSRPSKEVSQAEKQKTKPKTKEHTDASITLSEVNDAILRVPTFVPNFTNVENSECQQHGKIFLRQLRGYKLWALQMLDSSAKIPSGLLRGNVNQLGDYDQCLGVLAHVKVDEKTIRIQGKYCLATVDLHATHSDMRLPVNLMQARAFIRGNMHDPGHFIPKFTSFNWALCLPAACSAEDAEHALESTLKDYNGTVGIKFMVNVDPNMCYVKQKFQTYSKETIGVLYFYAMIICLVIVATVRDYFVETRGKGNYSERIIMSFSLRRTIKALLKEATDAADITCIYGIRALATIVLYVAHQLITISRIPFSNRTSLTEIANSPASSILRVSLVYTDAFLLLSGVLTAYNMAKELKTRGEIRWFCRFIARFIRLSPALLAVIFWYAFVMEHVGSGPQWNSVVMANAELCKYNAWTNLLYVQNFFPFEEMCATHTYQLALDMQLSLLAPILVFFLQYKLIIGMLLMAFLILLSATLRYIATMNNYLSLVIYHGISLKRLYKTANLTYALPLHRATPYVFGVGLGVLLHYTGKNVRIHRVLVILGWLIAITLGSWSLFSPWRQAKRDYVYDAEEATHYAVIGPVLWAAALCWSIFACFTGHGGSVNRFLSSYSLMILSRISYAVYLTQFAVFFYNVGTTRFSTEFQLHRAVSRAKEVRISLEVRICSVLEQ
ncbi:Nose resistant to fluoxetine protein 6 [Trachymyrmex zeteki]|uniref:Nose resistant to fluoxetine protein 6 n=1 Tax=Mycetomoellerius zeteki TaxID=64791 RepID=A0A151WKZ4_9HYME|nr:Nose resistant to fluoxetine protein 6 [Trachymyrmex zeteki]